MGILFSGKHLNPCGACSLCKQVKSPKMPPSGQGGKRTLIIGEAPGKVEDEQNKQFVGESGELLNNCLSDLGYNLDEDFYKINSINCRPTTPDGKANRPPTSKEIEYCNPYLWEVIEELSPSVIFLMGDSAIEAFFLNRPDKVFSDKSISRWNGLIFPDPITKAWVIATYHPSFILRSPDYKSIFVNNIREGIEAISIEEENGRPEFPEWEKNVEKLFEYDECISFLKSVLNKKEKIISVDYETSSKRPFYEGSKIWTVAIGTKDKGYAFPLYYPGHWNTKQRATIIYLLQQILNSQEIEKCAHSIQMEEIWSRLSLNVSVPNWIMDTMVLSPILFERVGIASLDFQVFINWGYTYGFDIEPFKKEVLGTHLNRMHEVPLSKLLDYNGLDAFFTRRLYGVNRKLLDTQPKKKIAEELFLDGIKCFVDMEETGISVDKKYYEETYKKLAKRIELLTETAQKTKEGSFFKKKTGREIITFDKEKNKVSLSNKDLSELFFKMLKVKSLKVTPKGGFSVDEDVLSRLKLDLSEKLTKIKKLEKMRTTYILGISKYAIEREGGYKIHPSFNLHIVRTFRSSSDSPNFQNIPIREEEAMNTVRKGIIPLPGYQIGWADYGGHEVRLIACYSKDPILCKVLKENGDVHQEWSDFLGVKRDDSKSGFVFPLIYGSYYISIHKDLISRGYVDLKERTVQKAEIEFWKKYAGVKLFQDNLIKFYKEHGYIEMFHGFRCGGVLSRNQIVNSLIQGSAFHLLLWSCIRLNKIRKEEQWRTTIPGQIHDEIFFNIYPKEEDYVKETTESVMTKQILEAHPWICVPLVSEFGSLPINKPWIKEKK